jgi:adenylosuccinate lyase
MNHQSIIFSKYLSEETMATIVSDEAFTNKMLQFEMALAKAQASLRIIPLQSADEISNTLSKIKIAPAELAEGTLQNGVPVITFLLIIKNLFRVNSKNIFITALRRRM